MQATTQLPVDPPQYVSNPNALQPTAKVYRLPEEVRHKSYSLGVILSVFGSVTMIISILGFALTSRYTILYASGVNLWTGLFYLLSGVFGILTYKIPINPHLMHNYYAFSFLAFLSSFIQLLFAILTITGYYGLGIALSMAAIIILSHNIYCKGCCYITGDSTSHLPVQGQTVHVVQPTVQPATQNQAVVQSPSLPTYGAIQYTAGIMQQPAIANNNTGTEGQQQYQPSSSKEEEALNNDSSIKTLPASKS
ncbi:uncharacterized protein TRIADDRAFT_63917 [Trichoplax adhaerens]|uniref:Expressed protein n=1 Tax=Trichoplax adhaerens TaxID=10228 RepID=B3RTS1_TRIAD|nr:expressed protein [Trichoplax adhaerens]EDV26186.1 expressed protein [Trichoplax adhaerens]|eukprot:XP_002112219.1 expressed protein [Trichoplax adhaerens]